MRGRSVARRARPDKDAARFCALLLLAALAACDDAAAPAVPEPDYRLVFEGVLDSVPEALFYDSASGAVRRLFAPGTIVTDPEPSPDGTRIAFVVANYVDGTADIWRINRDGTGLIQLTTDSEIDDHPSWSPDGTRIAFRSWQAGYLGDIWVMDADGGNPVNLTPDPLPGVTEELRPAWSPDGTRIVYGSNLGGNMDLWIMDADGGNKQQLTSTPDYDTEPAWSPDGSRIVFRRSSPSFGSILHVRPMPAGTETPLSLAGHQRMPVFSPDGQHIVFVGHVDVNDRPDLFRVRAAGTGRAPLVTSGVPGGSLNPAFLRRPATP